MIYLIIITLLISLITLIVTVKNYRDNTLLFEIVESQNENNIDMFSEIGMQRKIDLKKQREFAEKHYSNESQKLIKTFLNQYQELTKTK